MLVEFQTAAELRAHYAKLKERLNPSTKPITPPNEQALAQSVPVPEVIPPGYVTPTEAADKLGIPHAYVLYWCRRSSHAVKIKGRWLLDEKAFDVLLDSAGPPKTNTEGMWDCIRVASAHSRLSPSTQRAKQVIADLRWYFGQETEAAFMADRREPPRVFARWVAFYLLSRLTAWSLIGIARYLQRDHTTVLHGLCELRKLRVEDASVDFLLSWLESKYVD